MANIGFYILSQLDLYAFFFFLNDFFLSQLSSLEETDRGELTTAQVEHLLDTLWRVYNKQNGELNSESNLYLENNLYHKHLIWTASKKAQHWESPAKREIFLPDNRETFLT